MLRGTLKNHGTAKGGGSLEDFSGLEQAWGLESQDPRGAGEEREGGREGVSAWLAPCVDLEHRGHLCKEERLCMGREGRRKAKGVRVGYQDGRINPSHPKLCNILKFNFELLSVVLGATFYSDGLHFRGVKCLLKN